jgi:hypothetical protein
MYTIADQFVEISTVAGVMRRWAGEYQNTNFEEGFIDLAEGMRGDGVGRPVRVVDVSFQEDRSGGSFEWRHDPVPRFVITLSVMRAFKVTSDAIFTIQPGDVVLETNAQRFAGLQAIFPPAERGDWRQRTTGQGVQIIEHDPVYIGIFEFDTEIVSSDDRSLVALLGPASGASTATWIILRIVGMCLRDEPAKPHTIIPSYGESMNKNAEPCRRGRTETRRCARAARYLPSETGRHR